MSQPAQDLCRQPAFELFQLLFARTDEIVTLGSLQQMNTRHTTHARSITQTRPTLP